MRLAFCLFKYFPHSGLARDMLRIADEAVRRGHHVDLYAREWRGDAPAAMPVTVLDGGGLTNHGRAKRFIHRLRTRLDGESYDAVVGFNKMPGLDFYYAADGCFAARTRRRYPRAYELTPRYRSWHRLEAAVFGAGSRTRALLLSEQARLEYRAFHATAEERMRVLPPTLDPAHRREPLAPDRRAAVRTGLGADEEQTLVLLVGSGFHTKGVDRALRAVGALPAAQRRRTRLVIAGRGKAGRYEALRARLNLVEQVKFLGGRDDVPELLRAADLLIHPARQENTGAVLLEALAAGLPVITTAVCGYSHHIRDAAAGRVLPAPFDQDQLDRALHELVASPDLPRLAGNARRYGQDEALYRMPEAAVDLIESWWDGPSGPAFPGYVHPELAELLAERPRLDDWVRVASDTPGQRWHHNGRGYVLKSWPAASGTAVGRAPGRLTAPVPDAGMAWLAGHVLRTLGIPTPMPVAYGRGAGRRGRPAFLVTRDLPEMIDLGQYAARGPAAGPSKARRRRALIHKLGGTLRAMHANGINHRCLRLSRFLFDAASRTEADIELYLIDLEWCRVGHRAPRRWCVRDLADLHQSALDAGVTRRDQLRFVNAYSGSASLRHALNDRSFWARVVRRGEPRRATRSSRQRPPLWHLTDAGHRCPLLEDICTRPESVMARGRTLKHDGTTTVTAVSDGERRWVIKRYNTKNRWHAVRRVFQTSRALRCWRAAAWLAEAGIRTARPVAVLEERRWRLLRGRSYFVCELVDGETLDQALDGTGPNHDRLIARVVAILQRLRDHGIVHGDMKATNFVVNSGEVFLVDLDATRRGSRGRVETGQRRDRERFLENWADRPAVRHEFDQRLG